MDLIAEIKRLKVEKDALLLAHYYVDGAIQDIADFVGDSLDLARAAKRSDKKRIIFAGVHFMAEGAKILNPASKVLIPDMKAGCSLADSCPADAFASFKAKVKNPFVVSYINCSSEIKAMSDVICTSSNVEQIISRVPRDKTIIFAPDKNLGHFIQKKTGRPMLLWQGSCIVHETFSQKKLIEIQLDHPDAVLIAHPECESWLLDKANFVGSTSKLLQYVKETDAKKIIIATEAGILHQMKKEAPDKLLIPAPPHQNCQCNDCPYMKMNTLEAVYNCLVNDGPEINISPELQKKALAPLETMLEWSQ